MELLLVRHALPERRRLDEGPADPELSPEGREQSARLATYLRDEHLDAVYTSPLRRAVETAEPVAAAHGLDPMIVDGVAEWDRHASEYVPMEELKGTDDPRWQALLDGTWESDETPEDFHGRVEASLEHLVARHRGQRIAVICHGGVINSYVARTLGIARANVGFFYPNYTSIQRIAAASTGERSVVTLNETAHLRGSGLTMGLFQTGRAQQ